MSQSLTRGRGRSPAGTAPRRRVWRWRRAAFGLLLLAIVVALLPRLFFYAAYRDDIRAVAEVPFTPVAIVFGAGIHADGSATPVLYDRVATAAALYHEGRVSRLLLTGDGQSPGHDEPAAMRAVALALRVPESALLLDPAGIRTYESCSRARDQYGVQQAVLVTQQFHLPRAMFLCDQLGVAVTGVAAEGHPYPWRLRAGWQVREVLASAGAWWDVNILRPR